MSIHDKPNAFLFPEEMEMDFYKSFQELQLHYGCTYLFFSYQNLESQDKITFQTDPEWNNTYIENDLFNYCPIIKQGAVIVKANINKDNLLKWDHFIPKNNKEKMVIDARKDHNIFHGLSVVHETEKVRKMFGIATDISNKNFERYVIDSPQTFINNIKQMRSKADKLLVKYHQANK